MISDVFINMFFNLSFWFRLWFKWTIIIPFLIQMVIIFLFFYFNLMLHLFSEVCTAFMNLNGSMLLILTPLFFIEDKLKISLCISVYLRSLLLFLYHLRLDMFSLNFIDILVVVLISKRSKRFTFELIIIVGWENR